MELFRTTNFLGPLYHAALLLQACLFIALLLLLFSANLVSHPESCVVALLKYGMLYDIFHSQFYKLPCWGGG